MINFVAAPTKKQDGERYRIGRTSDTNDTLTKLKKLTGSFLEQFL
jgi:hypothetical protein